MDTLHLLVVKSQLNCGCLQEGYLRFFPESSRPGKAITLVRYSPRPSRVLLVCPLSQSADKVGWGQLCCSLPQTPPVASMQERPVNIRETDEEKSW